MKIANKTQAVKELERLIKRRRGTLSANDILILRTATRYLRNKTVKKKEGSKFKVILLKFLRNLPVIVGWLIALKKNLS